MGEPTGKGATDPAGPLVIDTHMHGRPRITGAFVVRGDKTALVETGPKSSIEHVRAGLRDAGIDDLDLIIVTHIHLDHAGAAGTLAADFPGATVCVHGIGAPHLADPSKLWASATRIYGDDMDRLWGGIDPIPHERIRVLEDRDVVDLGGRTVTAIETPGHAYHHHAYLDDATGMLFSGDALGVRLPDVGVIRPATPPPEFHLEKAIDSIELIRRLAPSSVCFTHFGPAEASVDALCDEAIASYRVWGEWVIGARARTDDLDEAAGLVREQARAALEQSLSEDAMDRMDQTTSYWMNTWGYMRYFDKAATKT